MIMPGPVRLPYGEPDLGARFLPSLRQADLGTATPRKITFGDDEHSCRATRVRRGGIVDHQDVDETAERARVPSGGHECHYRSAAVSRDATHVVADEDLRSAL